MIHRSKVIYHFYSHPLKRIAPSDKTQFLLHHHRLVTKWELGETTTGEGNIEMAELSATKDDGQKEMNPTGPMSHSRGLTKGVASMPALGTEIC